MTFTILHFFEKFRSYQRIFKGFSYLFTLLFLGLFINLLINQAYPISHLFFLTGILIALLGGSFAEIIHRLREQKRLQRRISQILTGQN
jgi:tetrahydromethanopterin S-methyltransferase subunit E